MFIAILLLLLTLVVLIAGILLMAKGGRMNKKYGNKFMVARVAFQAFALISIGILYFIYHSN